MSKRINISSGTEWEKNVGYSRAVRIGNIIEVAGTTSVQDGQVAYPGDAYLQTKRIIEIAKDALSKVGAELSDVIRTRIYVTNINTFETVGKAHGEYFDDIKPASTLIEVSAFANPELVVEIEFSAVITPLTKPAF